MDELVIEICGGGKEKGWRRSGGGVEEEKVGRDVYSSKPFFWGGGNLRGKKGV